MKGVRGRGPLARTSGPSLLALLLILGPLCAGARAQAATTPRPSEPSASVTLTALDGEKKSVTALKAEDLRLIVDGAPREILGLRSQAGLPLLLAVVIDTSASQEGVLPYTKMAAQVFVRGVMVPGFDRAAVVTFSHETTLEQALTDDVTQAREAVGRVEFVPPPGYLGRGVVVAGPPPAGAAGSTGLWDAVHLVADEVLSPAEGAGRRAVLLVTDGVDTSSRLKLDDAVRSAWKSGAAVYAVGVGDEKAFDGVDKGALRKLAERTGGRAFFPKKTDELPAIFKQIDQELRSQYVITFAAPGPARDGAFHKVKIEVAEPSLRKQGLDIAYPRGFRAGDAPAAVRK